MKKKLVFHFFCDDGWKENPATMLHFLCIRYFQDLFDEITIVIATDKAENKPFLAEIRHFIIDSVDCTNLTVKVAKNSVYREGKTYYDEVLENEYDGIVFFAHSKGYTNFLNDGIERKYIIEWILGSYWSSLSFPDEVEAKLSMSTKQNNALFFGPYMVLEGGNVPLNSVYPGSFYWTNAASLRRTLAIEGKNMPKMGNRMFAEEFPGAICLLLGLSLCETHNAVMLKGEYFDFYGKDGKYGAEEAVKTLCEYGDKSEYDGYLKFKEEILSEFKNPG